MENLERLRRNRRMAHGTHTENTEFRNQAERFIIEENLGQKTRF
jgi:hypothetical protein